MPSLCAVSATFFGPTSRSSCAYTVLSDFSVAWTRFIVPAYVLLYVFTFQGPKPGTLRWSGLDTYVVEFGFTPSSSAVTSTIGLNADPGWRWPCAARVKVRLFYGPPRPLARRYPVLRAVPTTGRGGSAGRV